MTSVQIPFGLIKYLFMCLGLKNVAQSFQWLMDPIITPAIPLLLY
jgi:hypothetical protein